MIDTINYIGRLLRHDRRREPPQVIALWNMHDRAIDDLPKTNNSVEGWHRKMSSAVNAHHPNIWKFFDVIRKEQCLNNAITAQAMAGHAPPPPRQQYVTTARRIVQVVQMWDVHVFLADSFVLLHAITVYVHACTENFAGICLNGNKTQRKLTGRYLSQTDFIQPV